MQAADLAGAAQDSLLGYGVVGLVALVLGWFAWGAIKRDRQRSDELIELERQRAADAEARFVALSESVRTEFVPSMTRATDALLRLADYLPALSSSPRRGS